MKSVIQLSVILVTLLGLFSGLSLYFNYTENKGVSTFALALFAICGLGVALLFKADKKRESSETDELNLAVADQVKQILASKQPYQLRASPFSLFFKAILALAISFLMIIFGLVALSKSHPFISTFPFLIGGYILSVVFVQGSKLLRLPIIQIDKNNITHFALGEIPWSEVSNIYLSILERQGVKVFTLQLEVLNTKKYSEYIGNFGRIFLGQIRDNTLQLGLPTSEMNAKVIEALSKAYAKIAGAPTLDTKIEKLNQLLSEIEKVNKLETIPEKEKQLLSLFEQSSTLSQEISSTTSQRVKEASKTIKKMKILFAIGVVFILMFLWLQLSK